MRMESIQGGAGWVEYEQYEAMQGLWLLLQERREAIGECGQKSIMI